MIGLFTCLRGCRRASDSTDVTCLLTSCHLQEMRLKMDEDFEKRAIETMPVVSSLRFHTAYAKNKAGYRVNVRCGCGAKQVGPVCKSSKRPTFGDCLRERSESQLLVLETCRVYEVAQDGMGRIWLPWSWERSVGWPRSHGKIKGHSRHHARQGTHIDRKNHLVNASGSALAIHLLQQRLGHGAHRHEDSIPCKGIMACFSFMFLGVPRHYARRSFSCWCTSSSRVCGRGHGSNSCGPNLVVQGCTRTKQTFWTEDEFTVTSSSGIRNRVVRVEESQVRPGHF